MEEDWNNLIILDGCRYDIFKELNTLKGDLNQAINYGELAVQKASTPGDLAVARIYLAWARSRAGTGEDEAEVLETLIPVFRTSRFVVAELFSTAILGESYWLAKQYDQAKHYDPLAL